MYMFERWSKHEMNSAITTCCVYDMVTGEKIALVINDNNEISFHLWNNKLSMYSELLYAGKTMDELQAAITKHKKYMA